MRDPHPLVAALKVRREELGWSMHAVARLMGRHHGVVSRAEAGITDLSLLSLTEYAAAMGGRVVIEFDEEDGDAGTASAD